MLRVCRARGNARNMEHATGMQPVSARSRQRKARLRTLDHLDQRTRAAKRARSLAGTFEAALGGTLKLTDAQMQAVRNAAAAVAISEDAQARRLQGDTSVSLDEVIRAARHARAAVHDLGIDRQREPDAPSPLDLLSDRHA